jgi:hypothetical protein
MAVKPLTRKHTFDATGQTSLAAIYGRPDNIWYGAVVIRAGPTNTGIITWSDEDGSPGGYLDAAESIAIDCGPGQALIGNFNLAGPEGDEIYVTLLMDRIYFDGSDNPK